MQIVMFPIVRKYIGCKTGVYFGEIFEKHENWISSVSEYLDKHVHSTSETFNKK